MAISLSITQLRNLLQLPERPFEDVFYYDGTSYYDLSHREPCTMFNASGTVASGPFLFRLGTDFQLTAGAIDWTLPGGTKPDLLTKLTVDYTYSKLGNNTASTCVNNAQIITTMDLGSSFPYGSASPQGIAYNDLATFGASFVASREACVSLASTEIDLAEKGRRGSVLLDDSKKTEDWDAQAKDWDARYKQYLTMIRPGGMVRSFQLAGVARGIFGLLDRSQFEGLFGDIPYALEYGGF